MCVCFWRRGGISGLIFWEPSGLVLKSLSPSLLSLSLSLSGVQQPWPSAIRAALATLTPMFLHSNVDQDQLAVKCFSGSSYRAAVLTRITLNKSGLSLVSMIPHHLYLVCDITTDAIGALSCWDTEHKIVAETEICASKQKKGVTPKWWMKMINLNCSDVHVYTVISRALYIIYDRASSYYMSCCFNLH